MWVNDRTHVTHLSILRPDIADIKIFKNWHNYVFLNLFLLYKSFYKIVNKLLYLIALISDTLRGENQLHVAST